jgi:hypothetical protein
MGAISQDLSSAGIAAAIETNWIAAFGHWSQAPRIELHDEEPDLRWYVTPGVPVPLFNHAYFTRLSKEGDIDARIEALVEGFAEHEVPFMWSVGPFTQPADLGDMAVDLHALNEDVTPPSGLVMEQVSDTEVLSECIEDARVHKRGALFS